MSSNKKGETCIWFTYTILSSFDDFDYCFRHIEYFIKSILSSGSYLVQAILAGDRSPLTMFDN